MNAFDPNETLNMQPAAHSGAFSLGGDLPVFRLGFGAMRIVGPGVWGEPADRNEALAVLRRTTDLGINFIDTADSYGPYISEELIREALHPYPHGLVIATKAGFVRTGPGAWTELGHPEYLRQECEMSLRRLKLDRIDLFQLHRIDPKIPAEDQFGLLADLQKEGKVRHVGLSEVSVAEIEAGRKIVPIASVQNLYNLVNRQSQAAMEYCTREKIGFIPWFPLATGELAQSGGPLDLIAKELRALPAQVALAWLLQTSPAMLPIPGTSSVRHLDENTNAALLHLNESMMERLDRMTSADSNEKTAGTS